MYICIYIAGVPRSQVQLAVAATSWPRAFSALACAPGPLRPPAGRGLRCTCLCPSISQVQGSKIGIPACAFGAKIDFCGVPFSKTVFHRFEDAPRKAPRPFFIDFDSHDWSSKPLKTLMPSSTSFKDQVFLVPAPKISPDSALAVFRSGLTASRWVSWTVLGSLLATLTGVPVNKIQF